jgi:GT2 family glycosyltransferase
LNEESDLAAGEKLAADRIAVIVVNYNGRATLMRCLDSLHGQTMPPRRVVVVDNASTDGSASAAAAAFPAFTFCRLSQNTGFAAANNYAARLVDECEWLALLNPDAYASSTWLERLWAAAKHNREFAFFGSRMLMDDDPTRIDGVGDVYHVTGLSWRGGHRVPAGGYALEFREVFSPCAAAALFRRADFLEVGGFDEDFFCYMEDVDLGFRLRLRGLRCLYVPEAIVRHSGSASTGGRHSDFSVYHGHRNLVWVFVKNMPAVLLMLLFPLHLAMNLVTIAVFTVRGQGGTILRSKRDALRAMRTVWRKRARVQKESVVTASAIFRMLNKQIVPRARR